MPKKFLIYSTIIFALSVAILGALNPSILLTSISKVYAAVFDSDLIPAKDSSYDLGKLGVVPPDYPWKNARFSGNVGIGVNSESDIIAGSDRLVIGPINPVDYPREGGQLKIMGTSSNKYFIFDNYDGDFRIITASGTESERVRVTNAGRVLIGTSTTMVPGEKLEVVGNIISKGTAWATSTSAANNNWRSVTYGNGLFVAVSYTGTYRVMTSSDGINWATSTTPDSNNWRSVTYGNGLFVAVASSGSGACADGVSQCVMTSPDGTNWTLQVAPTDNVWHSVTYGNGLFVAVSGNNYGTCTSANKQCVMASPDGINWTLRDTPANNYYWYSVTYGNGLFVAVSTSGTDRVMTSPDSITWTSQTSAANNTWRSVTYGNGLFVAVSGYGIGTCLSGIDNRCIMTSPDGGLYTPWQLRNASTIDAQQAANNWYSVTYGNGLFVAVAISGSSCISSSKICVITSYDGINWTPRPAPIANYWYSITYGNGLFVAVSESGTYRVMTSGKPDYQSVSYNNTYQGGMKILGGTVAVGTTTQTALFHVAKDNINALYISSSTGNIGIGTNNPSNTNALTVDGVGGIRIRQPSATRYRSDYFVSNSSTSIISYDDTGATFIPLNLYGQSITFNAGNGGAEKSSIDASGYWYLGGTTPTNGLRIKGSDTTDTIFQPSGNLGITVNSGNLIFNLPTGKVGIGTDPNNYNEKLQVYGNIRIGSSASNTGCIQSFNGNVATTSNPAYSPSPYFAGACSSDIALKKNLVPLTGSLEKIAELKPTYFNWRVDEYPELHLNGNVKNLGLIAQDVEKVFPELVGRDEYGLKTVDYGSPLMMNILEAVKELNDENKEIEERIKYLESR